MAGYGVPARAIALVLRISTDELRAHFHAELDRCLAVGTVAVAQNLYKLATGGDRSALAAATTWLKCLAGWSEFSPGPSDSPLGKKEQQRIDAETADEDTGWRGLVN